MAIFSSLLDEALEAWEGVREGLIEEVENVPAHQFGFWLVPETRSVTELVQHVLEVGLMMTGELCRPDTDFHRAPWPKLLKLYDSDVSKATTKKQLMGLLRSTL